MSIRSRWPVALSAILALAAWAFAATQQVSGSPRDSCDESNPYYNPALCPSPEALCMRYCTRKESCGRDFDTDSCMAYCGAICLPARKPPTDRSDGLKRTDYSFGAGPPAVKFRLGRSPVSEAGSGRSGVCHPVGGGEVCAVAGFEAGF